MLAGVACFDVLFQGVQITGLRIANGPGTSRVLHKEDRTYIIQCYHPRVIIITCKWFRLEHVVRLQFDV